MPQDAPRTSTADRTPERPSILIISYFSAPYNTPASYRVSAFCQAFAGAGFKVHLLTAKTTKAPVDEQLGERLRADATLHRIDGWEFIASPGPGRLARFSARVWNALNERLRRWCSPVDDYALWCWPALVAARRIIREHGIGTVLVSSPPHSTQIIGTWLKHNSQIRLVADFRDAWSHSHSHKRNGLLSHWLNRTLELRTVSIADRVLHVTTGNLNLLHHDLPQAQERTQLVLNGFFRMDVPAAHERTPTSPAGKIRIAYTGELYKGFAPVLFNVLAELKRRNSDLASRLEIVVAGLIEQSDWPLAQQLEVAELIDYRGFVSFSQCVEIVRHSHIGLVLLPSNWTGVHTSKLFFYLGQRIPILAIVPNGDAADVVRDVNAGLVCPPDDPKRASDIIEQWLAGKHPPIEKYDDDAWNRYSREEQCGSVVDWVREDLQTRNCNSVR